MVIKMNNYAKLSSKKYKLSEIKGKKQASKPQSAKVLDYKSLLVKSYVLIDKSLEERLYSKQFEEKLRQLINRYSVLSLSEKSKVYDSIYAVWKKMRWHISDGKWKELLYRKVNYDTLFSAMRRAYATSNSRIKHDSFLRAVENGYIFFFCAGHDNCSDMHKPLQNKLYITRHWRLYVKPTQYEAVLQFIKQRSIMTVEEAMGKPYWLCSRPFCKHFFQPIDTDTVLNTPLNIFVRRYHQTRKPIYSDFDYSSFKKDIMKEVRRALNT